MLGRDRERFAGIRPVKRMSKMGIPGLIKRWMRSRRSWVEWQMARRKHLRLKIENQIST